MFDPRCIVLLAMEKNVLQNAVGNEKSFEFCNNVIKNISMSVRNVRFSDIDEKYKSKICREILKNCNNLVRDAIEESETVTKWNILNEAQKWNTNNPNLEFSNKNLKSVEMLKKLETRTLLKTLVTLKLKEVNNNHLNVMKMLEMFEEIKRLDVIMDNTYQKMSDEQKKMFNRPLTEESNEVIDNINVLYKINNRSNNL